VPLANSLAKNPGRYDHAERVEGPVPGAEVREAFFAAHDDGVHAPVRFRVGAMPSHDRLLTREPVWEGQIELWDHLSEKTVA
jgi:hypothetical protein